MTCFCLSGLGNGGAARVQLCSRRVSEALLFFFTVLCCDRVHSWVERGVRDGEWVMVRTFLRFGIRKDLISAYCLAG